MGNFPDRAVPYKMVNFFGARTFFRSCECWNVTFLGGSDEPRPNILGTCSSRPAPTPHGRKKIFPRPTTSGGHPQRPPKPLFSRFLADAATVPAQTFGPGVIPPGAPPCATRSSVPPLLDPKRPPISPTRPPPAKFQHHHRVPRPKLPPSRKNLLHPRSTTPHSPRKPPPTHPNLHFFRHPTKIKNNKTTVKNHLFHKSSRILRQGGFRPC